MELWDLYDRDGRATGETWERTPGSFRRIPEGRYHMVCDILVRHVDGTFLLTKRHPEKDVYPGYWEASAGGSAVTGEDSIMAAKRELFEETGIRAEEFRLISHTFSDKSHSMFYSYLTTVDCAKDSIVLQEGETTEYKWVDRAGLLEYLDSDLAIKTHNNRYASYFEALRGSVSIENRRNSMADTGKQITYRKLKEKDLDVFINMRITQLAEEYEVAGREIPKDVELEYSLREYYRKHMAEGTFVSWLALDGDKIIGTSGMSYVEKPPYFSCPTGRLGLLSSMYTDPGYRRMGIGKELLHRVVEEARNYGCGSVWITASDMGVKLYTAFGFEHNGNFMQYKL